MKTTESNTFWKTLSGTAGLAVLLAILVAVNIIAGAARLRVDLTEDQLYTLSSGTVNVLKKLDRPVTLKLFFNSRSPEVPIYLKDFAREVDRLLNEYRLAGKGKLIIEKYEPEPDSEAEEWARRYGIHGQAMEMFGDPIYRGIAAVSGQSQASIPVLDPSAQELLEYNLTRLIYRVAHPEKPRIGVLSSLPVMGVQGPQFAMPGQPSPGSQPPWFAFGDLLGDYQLEEIDPSVRTIDEKISALIVVHPKELEDSTLFALDQFVLRGGRMLVLLDPLSVADSASSPAQMGNFPRLSSNLEKLLTAWGLRFSVSEIAADLQAATPIPAANNRIEKSPIVLSLGKANFDAKDLLTAQMSNLTLAYAGAFFDETSEDLTVTPLISTSADAGMINALSAQFGGAAIMSQFKKEGVRHLAVRVSGKFKSAFPGGDPTGNGGAGPALQEGESAVLLIGDVDMIYDPVCVEKVNMFGFSMPQPRNDNLAFFANAVEQISGSVDLISIRSRGRFNRPFDRVDKLEHAAAARWQENESALIAKLQETQRQIDQMQATKTDDQLQILSREQREAIERFREDEIRIKRELKEVRKNLRRDIDRLGIKLKVINIMFMPLLVGLTGLGYGWIRRSRRG